MKECKHTVCVDCGSIYDMNGNVVENPAILLDKDSGCVHGCGDIEIVSAKFERMASAYDQAGMRDMAESLLLLDFSDAFFHGATKEEICYILRRATEYTASGFQKRLCKHAVLPDFKAWLHGEMKAFPIDLSERER